MLLLFGNDFKLCSRLIDVTDRPCCFLRISSDGFQLFLTQPPFLCTLQTPKNYFEQEVDDLGEKVSELIDIL